MHFKSRFFKIQKSKVNIQNAVSTNIFIVLLQNRRTYEKKMLIEIQQTNQSKLYFKLKSLELCSIHIVSIFLINNSFKLIPYNLIIYYQSITLVNQSLIIINIIFKIKPMGSCMNGDKQRANKLCFQEDKILIQKTQTYEPIYSTVYGILRKPTDVQRIYTNPPSNKYFSVEAIQKMDPKQIKTLFSFKKIIIIGKFQNLEQIIKKISTSCSVGGIYVLQQKDLKKFQEYFPIFSSENRIITNQIPLLVFDSQQLLNPSSSRCTLFIHLSQNKNEKIYSALNIKKQNIISAPDSTVQKQKIISHYGTKLRTIQSGNYLLLHNKNMDQNSLLQIISNWLIQRYDISQLSTKKYLARTLPKAFILSNKSQLLIAQNELKTKKNNEENLQSSIQLYEKLFKKHRDQNGAQKTQRAYNLLVKLITNIYSNQNNQNYKKVKAANKQMEQLLTRSKYGKKLLEQVGFKQKQGFWVNVLQDKYLKIIRTDLDLAFKNYSQ